MIGWIAAALFVAFVIAFIILVVTTPDCDRENHGWPCKGDRCNHAE